MNLTDLLTPVASALATLVIGSIAGSIAYS